MIWQNKASRTTAHLWRGLVDGCSNKYQTGGLQHLLARQIRSEVGAQIFSGYFKFTIVRNPWDKAVSQFVYMKDRPDLRDFVGMKTGDSFKKYLELIAKVEHVQWLPQAAFIRDLDGRMLVDYVGRFEAFTRSVTHILKHVGVDGRSIPHEKRGARGPYQEYYDAESREMVAEMYASDIEMFDYNYADCEE